MNNFAHLDYMSAGQTSAVIATEPDQVDMTQGAAILGYEFMPKSARSLLRIRISIHGWSPSDNNLVIALFRNGRPQPIALTLIPLLSREVNSTDVTVTVATHRVELNSFQVRVGPSRAGLICLNYDDAGNRLAAPYPFLHIHEEIPELSQNVVQILRGELDRLNMIYDNTQSIPAHRALHALGDTVRLLEDAPASVDVAVPPFEVDPLVAIFEKIEVSEAQVFRKGTAILLIIGQSNAANEGTGRYTAGEGVYNWNYLDGKYYKAVDPLLGATGIDGSFASRLGDGLVREGVFPSVLLVPLAVGGTFMHDWTPQGRLHSRLMVALRRLRSIRRTPTHILWHQGEADSSFETPAAAYRTRFHAMLMSIRDQGVMAPIYVAVATRCGSETSPSIRAVQESLPNGNDILPGPDTDVITGKDRTGDGVHLSQSGLDRHAALWLEILKGVRVG